MTVDPNVLDFRYVLVKHHKKTGLPFRSRAHIFLAQKDTILGSSKRDSLELNRLSQDNLDSSDSRDCDRKQVTVFV